MPVARKILGQRQPAVSNVEALYACTTPEAVVSALVVCNTAGSFTQYDMGLNDAFLISQQIASTIWLNAAETHVWEEGITLVNGDTLYVYSNTAGTTFTAFGAEIT